MDLTVEHIFPPNNHTAASLLLSQLFVAWTVNILSKGHSKWPFIPPPKQTERPPKPIFDQDDFTPDDYELTGGQLTFTEDASVGSCSRGECEENVRAVRGSSFREDMLPGEGVGQVLYTDDSVLVGHFADGGYLHGLAYTLDSNRQVTSIGFYDKGWRVGRTFWKMESNFKTALYGELNSKDKFTSNANSIVLLNMYVASNALIATGDFKNGLLLKNPAQLVIKKIWFEHEGLFMRIEFDDETKSNDIEIYKPASNMKSSGSKFLAQSSWFAANALEESEPSKGRFIRNRTRYKQELEETMVTYFKSGKEECQSFLSYTSPAGSFFDRALACYPGSGSKWLIDLISMSSGLFVSGCLNTEEKGVKNPLEEVSAILTKTHHQSALRWKSAFNIGRKGTSKAWERFSESLPWRLDHIMSFGGRAVVLIRNPFEALISLFNHERSNSYDSIGGKGIKDLSESLHGPLFKPFVKREIQLWEEIYLDFLSLCTDVLVVHYEHMKENRERELRRIYVHLGLPLDEPRLDCTIKNDLDRYHRKSKPDYGQPYDVEMVDWIRRGINRVQEVLERRGFEPLPVEKYKFLEEKP